MRAQPEGGYRAATMHTGARFHPSAARRRVWIMSTNMTTLTQIWMMLLLRNILPSDHNVNLPLPKYQLVCAVMT